MKRTASLGSYTRSAARGTYSAYRSVPIRWRLAGGSAALTFVILLGFAAIVGVLTNRQVRGQFNDQVASDAGTLQRRLGTLHINATTGALDCDKRVGLSDFASSGSAQIRIIDLGSGNVYCTQDEVLAKGSPLAQVSPNFPTPAEPGTFDELGYRVAVRSIRVLSGGEYALLYARPYSDVDHTLAKIQVFLILGVFGGTILALLAGLATAGRAMRPIVELTDTAREIERTRDASLHVPHPEAEDEIAELARTLEGMLGALDSARVETEATLERQREFVADASHELRTPLTSVLANLELLADELAGEQADSAKAALRSTRRMRRLVGDLLLLARADAQREQRSRPTDLAGVLLDAVSELGPVAGEHHLTIDAREAVVEGVADDLHRLVLNLLENAVRHTPPGTEVLACTETAGNRARLVVQDSGPGIPPELAERVFERFVRGGRDGGRGSGLGLAIVAAVAESHSGTVLLERPTPADEAAHARIRPGEFSLRAKPAGTRFVIELPLAAPMALEPALQTSTTTGSTIGRRRSRS